MTICAPARIGSTRRIATSHRLRDAMEQAIVHIDVALSMHSADAKHFNAACAKFCLSTALGKSE